MESGPELRVMERDSCFKVLSVTQKAQELGNSGLSIAASKVIFKLFNVPSLFSQPQS